MKTNGTPSMEDIKAALDEMKIPYKEERPQANQLNVINSFGYSAFSLVVDLTHVDTVDAETGIVVKNVDITVDNGIYVFTVLHTGQAAFVVVIPGTISHAPMIRRISGDIISAISGIDMPPMMPYDMVEVMAHVLSSTFMKMIIEACNIPAEYHEPFLRIYMPKFLANMGMYYVGAEDKDGKPLIYEEVVNMEPMIIWNALQKKNGIQQDESDKADKIQGTPAAEDGKTTE